jgi:site-specific recombinase XerD
MQEIIAQFRQELSGVATFKDKTVQNYISILYKYFDYVKEQFRVEPIKAEPLHLRQWMVLNKTKVSNSRLTHHRAALNHFYGFLQKLGIREDNPAEALFPIRRQQSDKNQPIDAEVTLTLLRSMDRQNWRGERNFMIISLLWALGLRLNELVTLRVCDFEPNHDPLNKIGLVRIHGKGDKERALFVVDKLYDNLVHYLSHPQSPKGPSVPMFPNHKNEALSKHRVQRMIIESTSKAGLDERITPHVLRHSFATEMYQQEVPANAIQAMLGHNNLDESSIYIHVSDRQKKQALKNITIGGSKSCQ